MNQSRRLLHVLAPIRSLSPRQLHYPALSHPLSQPHRCTGNGNWRQTNITPQFSSFSSFSSVASRDGTIKDVNSSVGAGDGVEAAKATSKGTSEVAEGAAGAGSSKKNSDQNYESAEESDEAQQAKSDDSDKDISVLLREREVLLKDTDRMIAEMKTKVLSSLAEEQNIRDRTRREADGIKNYAVQNFATCLLEVADNLGRAAAAVPEAVRNEALANDSSNNSKLLKSLLEGVDMTQKQLMKIFNKFGLEKLDPVGQKFDPSQHLAIFEVQDSNKDPQTIVSVVKSGYALHDKVLRPAEVSVVKAEKAE